MREGEIDRYMDRERILGEGERVREREREREREGLDNKQQFLEFLAALLRPMNFWQQVKRFLIFDLFRNDIDIGIRRKRCVV